VTQIEPHLLLTGRDESAMPDQIDTPPLRPFLKLRSVSMREGPPDLLTNSRGQGGTRPTQGISVARLAPDKPRALPVPQAPASRTRAAAEADDDTRPVFTVRQTPRPTQPERPESQLLHVLPRTRYRVGNALTGDGGPPPIPAAAVLLLQQRSSRSLDKATRGMTPLQRLDDAVRRRLWDQFSTRHRKRRPSAGG